MTDNEIIKALDICGHLESCADCPLGDLSGIDKCMHTLLLNALDLINRQKAEIERLKDEVKEKTETITFLKDQSIGWSIDFCNLKAKLNTAKTEAIKEFAERLKEDLKNSTLWGLVSFDRIDKLVKEMTEGEHANG